MSALSFWISLAGFVLVGLWVLAVQAVKRRELGKVLWAAPLSAWRWLGLIWLVIPGLKIADVAAGSATRHMGLNILLVGGCLYLPVIIVVGPTFHVHEGGICIGLLCFSWREVAGWSWGSAPGEMVSLDIQGRDRRGLCVWTTSRWRLFYQLRPQRPICTRVAPDRDLEALLHKYATERLTYRYERGEDCKRAAAYFQKAAGKVRDMSSDTAAEKLATKGEESLTKLHESRFLVSKWWWGLLIAVTLCFGWLAVKHGRAYFYNVYVLGAPGQTFHLFYVVFFLFILALCWVGCLHAMHRGVHYVIHSHGLRVAGQVAIAPRFAYGFDFSDFEGARIPRWWERITTSAIGPAGMRGVMVTLRRRLPLSLSWAMLIGSSRRLYLPHKEPEVFLKELNCAWNGWRLTHGEGQAGPKSGSSAPASPPASTTSRAA